MPNTLAHAGVQGLATRTTVSEADLRWVYLGCVIPDVPWILQRAAHGMIPGIDPFALRAYVIIQASLLGCIVLSAAAALLAQAFWRTWALLGGNAVLHLGIDAMQTKWGNGVHFFAPFSWDLTNWGLFWPESMPTYLLTAFGLLYIAWHWRVSVSKQMQLVWASVPRLAAVLVLMGVYFLGPIFLLQQPIEADAHSLKTLSEPHGRAGRSVEMDRAEYVDSQDGYFLAKFGKRVPVEKLRVPAPATVSIQGRFVSRNTIRVSRVHLHASGLRDYPSYLGLAMILLLCIVAIVRGEPR